MCVFEFSHFIFNVPGNLFTIILSAVRGNPRDSICTELFAERWNKFGLNRWSFQQCPG